MVMAVSSALLGRDDPVFLQRLALALHHHRGIELVAADGAAPEELAVLRARGLGLEAHFVARRLRLVRSFGVAGSLAALEEDALECAPVEGEGFHGGSFGLRSPDRATAASRAVWGGLR